MTVMQFSVFCFLFSVVMLSGRRFFMGRTFAAWGCWQKFYLSFSWLRSLI